MYFRLIFVIASSFIFVAAITEDDIKNCEAKEKGIASLDFAIQLLSRAKEHYNEPICPNAPLPRDCEDILRNRQNVSGVYEICPKSRVAIICPLQVYCDMRTDGGGWTVIQRRGDYLRPNDYFYQDWQAYKNGFGSIEQDFWLGNDNIFALSSQKASSVRFDLQDVEGNSRYALYDTFWIDDESRQYTLHIGGYSGDAGDSIITTHNLQKFSTKDKDNDQSNDSSCATLYKGGWWYNDCHTSNLNGLYHKSKHESLANGVNWPSWKGYKESLEKTEIKIRNKNFRKIQ